MLFKEFIDIFDFFIVDYPPVLLSIHEDAGIRLWSMTGLLLHETVAMTRRAGVPATCYAADKRCNVLVTGMYTINGVDTIYITQILCF